MAENIYSCMVVVNMGGNWLK